MSRTREIANMLEMSPCLRETVVLNTSGSTPAVHVSRTGWLERLSIRFLHQPAIIRVELDSLGNHVLQHCDGNYTVQEIADLLLERFGREAEPLIPRLVRFLQIVEVNGWIQWKHQSIGKH